MNDEMAQLHALVGRDPRRRRTPCARARLARPRRPRRRWVRGACRSLHAAVGGRRPRRPAPHVGRCRDPGDSPSQRLRRRSPREPVLGLPAHGRRRADPPDGPLRRSRRDLERRAVVLAGLVPPATHHDRPPRARTDVGPDPAAAARRARPRARDPRRAAVLPPDRGGHAQRLDPRRTAGDRIRARTS